MGMTRSGTWIVAKRTTFMRQIARSTSEFIAAFRSNASRQPCQRRHPRPLRLQVVLERKYASWGRETISSPRRSRDAVHERILTAWTFRPPRGSFISRAGNRDPTGFRRPLPNADGPGESPMPPRLRIRKPTSREEAAAFGWVFFHGLAPVQQPTMTDVETFVDRIGPSRMRLAERGGEIVGGLALLDMGQYFGGRSVPMTGVSAVAVAPEHRSAGVGRALMEAAVRELRARRVALSGLYPATQPVYRRAGFEIAGVRQQWRVPTSALALGAREPAVRPMITEDLPALKACYATWASRRPGMLDRIDWGWRRVLESPDHAVRAHVVDAPRRKGLAGYVVTVRVPVKHVACDLVVRDLVALTPEVQRRLLTFLGDHRSIAPSTLLWLGPADATFMLPTEQERQLEFDWRWMLRIVDIERAMEARGFPAGLTCEVGVEIEDALVKENAGRWLIGCSGGAGRARRAGKRPVEARASVNGLAAIFGGHVSAHDAAAAGLLHGSVATLDALTAMFAGPAPWTPDMW